MAKILIVEDDADLADGVRRSLAAEMHNVEISSDGDDALDRVLEGSYDLIILDLGLPKIGGLEICQRYRAGGGKAPVLILTGKAEVDDRVAGLDNGADDYLTKPFHLKELISRIRALLRRPITVRSDVLKCGLIEIDLTSHSVHRAGVKLSLLPVDYALLEFFMRHPGEIFSSDTLLAKVWSTDKAFSDNAVRSAIRRLRRALDGADNKVETDSVIETMSKVGYRLVCH